MPQAPCMLCKDRRLGCHADCEKYKEYRVNKDEQNRKRQEYINKNIEHQLYKQDSIRKARKRRNQKK